MVMNVGLQEHTIRQKLKEKGVDPRAVDLEAMIDSSLHLDENIEELDKELPYNLKNDGGGPERDMSNEEWRRELREQGKGSLVVETISCSDGWTYQVEFRNCGKENCGKCPHGPYVYRHKTDANEHKSEYVKKADIPREVRLNSHELED